MTQRELALIIASLLGDANALRAGADNAHLRMLSGKVGVSISTDELEALAGRLQAHADALLGLMTGEVRGISADKDAGPPKVYSELVPSE